MLDNPSGSILPVSVYVAITLSTDRFGHPIRLSRSRLGRAPRQHSWFRPRPFAQSNRFV